VPGKPIDIELRLKDSTLVFIVQNWKRKGPPDMTNGVGLPNLRRRLAMFYKKKVHFEIKEEPEVFYVELIIPL
jgi:two-component system, LytTR family, sensor kinase